MDIFSRMIQTQIFHVGKFSRMLVHIDNFFSFIETYAWNKAWGSNILIKITANEIVNKKKRFLIFFTTYRFLKHLN